MSKILEFDDTFVSVDKISSCTIVKDLAFDIGSKVKYTLTIKTDSGMNYNVISGVEDKEQLRNFIFDSIYGNADGVISYEETPITKEEASVRAKKIKKDKKESQEPDEFKEEVKEKSGEQPDIELAEIEAKESLTKEKVDEVFEKAKKGKKKGD